MAVEEHERLARRLFDEVMTQGRYEALDELIHPGTVHLAREAITQIRSAFPDARVMVTNMVSDDDGVAGVLFG